MPALQHEPLLSLICLSIADPKLWIRIHALQHADSLVRSSSATYATQQATITIVACLKWGGKGGRVSHLCNSIAVFELTPALGK